MLNIFKILLGKQGFSYCSECGSDLIINKDLEWKINHGYMVSTIYECPNTNKHSKHSDLEHFIIGVEVAVIIFEVVLMLIQTRII